MFTQRSLMPPMMTTFDMCDTTLPCGQRDVTIVAPQALALLNNPFMHDRAAAIADLASTNADAVGEVWRLILKREPTDDERQLAVRHLDDQSRRFAATVDGAVSRKQSIASLALVLFNSNEFAFVD